MKRQKIWALLVHLSMHFAYDYFESLPFDDDMWQWTLENAVQAGYNTIILDVGDGLQFASHPEIAAKGAWTREKMRAEVARCREMGLTLIPKLNFSAPHSNWLGKYRRMISTDVYYEVCQDLIKEVYELFDHPDYIHIGMDEEDEAHGRKNKEGYFMIRRGELYWHDLRFLLNCVKATGAKPWIWYDAFTNHHEEYVKRVEKNEVLLSPWYYHQLKPECFAPISEYKHDMTQYAGLDLRYIEDIPVLARFREKVLDWAKEGNIFVPTSWAARPGNTYALMEYFRNGAPDAQMAGLMVSLWFSTQWENKELFETAFREFKEAKEKFYPEG